MHPRCAECGKLEFAVAEARAGLAGEPQTDGLEAGAAAEVSVLGQWCEALVTRYGDLVIAAQP